MDKGPKRYLVIGSNNFWYGLCGSLAEARSGARDIMNGDGSYADEESGHTPETPQEIYIYQAYEVDRIYQDDGDGDKE